MQGSGFVDRDRGHRVQGHLAQKKRLPLLPYLSPVPRVSYDQNLTTAFDGNADRELRRNVSSYHVSVPSFCVDRYLQKSFWLIGPSF